MEHWTNGRFRSTCHRVQPRTGSGDRYSLALFLDPDDAVEVSCLPSCVSEQNPARYPQRQPESTFLPSCGPVIADMPLTHFLDP